MSEAMLNTYALLLLEFDEADFFSVSEARWLYMLFTLCMVITLLNLLIAVLSESHKEAASMHGMASLNQRALISRNTHHCTVVRSCLINLK